MLLQLLPAASHSAFVQPPEAFAHTEDPSEAEQLELRVLLPASSGKSIKMERAWKKS
jgi:hypothetical protein